jgi:hypothetical protein
MQRRKFLLGMGSLAAGGAAAIGTGAFTSGTVERDAVVNVASSDSSGYIGLSALSGPNNVHVEPGSSAGGGLKVNLADTNVGGDGVNEDGEFLFDNLFEIRNQGTQPVWIWADGAGSVTPYVMDGEGMGGDGDRRAIEPGSADQGAYDLGDRGMAFHFFVGERKRVGFEVNSSGVATDSDIGGTLNLFAAANKDEVPGDGGFDVQSAPSGGT